MSFASMGAGCSRGLREDKTERPLFELRTVTSIREVGSHSICRREQFTACVLGRLARHRG
jgi:hypothetical protein